MEIEFGGQYDRTTYFRAIRWAAQPSKRALILRIGLFVLFLGFYTVYAVAILQEPDVSAFRLARLPRHVITLALLGYLIFKPYIDANRAATHLWADPAVRRQISGYISGVGVQIAPSETWIEWKQFIRALRSDDLVVLTTVDRTALVLPRNFFRDERDWSALQNLIAGKIPALVA